MNRNAETFDACIPEGLTLQPSGVEVFHDRKRRKDFTTLHYHFQSAKPMGALAFAEEVLADLGKANVPVTRPVSFTLSNSKAGWTLHMEVPIGNNAGKERPNETLHPL